MSITFRLEIIGLQKFLYPWFLYCGLHFCQPAYTNNGKTQTLMTHTSKTSEDRYLYICTI